MTSKYVRKIIIIICLTNIPMLLFMPVKFKISLGWMLGSFASGINFYWLARSAFANLSINEGKTKVGAVKNYYFRYLFLVIFSVLCVWIIKPDIISYGIALLSAQIAIYINEIYEYIKKSKYAKYLRR